jgi:hypothetical protein
MLEDVLEKYLGNIITFSPISGSGKISTTRFAGKLKEYDGF